jgi:hypothetical protein
MDSMCMWTELPGPWWFQCRQQIKTNIRSRLMHYIVIYQNVQYLRNKADPSYCHLQDCGATAGNYCIPSEDDCRHPSTL